jgi:hypothetical protein
LRTATAAGAFQFFASSCGYTDSGHLFELSFVFKAIWRVMKQDKSAIVDDDEVKLVSLNELIAVVWQSRLTVILIIFLVLICGLAFAMVSAKYRSEGFFQFGGPIPVPVRELGDKTKEKDPGVGVALVDYKRYSASFATLERFAEYVKEKGLESEGVDRLRRDISVKGITNFIEPVYPFTKLDAKDLVEQPKDSSNNVIGLRITYDSKTPLVAQQMVGLLGRYAIDSIAYNVYSDLLRFKCDEINTKIVRLENTIIEKKTQLEEFRRRATDLRQIISRNPGAAGDSTRQVVTVTEDTAVYLPPVTQLATTEVQATEANEAIFKAKRMQMQSKLYLEYYEQAKLLLDSSKSGETILRGLDAVKKEFFKEKDLNDDAVKEVYNKITVDNQNAINVYMDKSRFIAGPTFPDKSNVRPVLTVAISLIFGLILALVFVFSRKWFVQSGAKAA